MLPLLTHPLVCLAYFVALHVAFGRLFGEVRTAAGFVGRGLLFGAASLTVSTAAFLVGGYSVGGGPPETALGMHLIVIFIMAPVLVLLILLTGMFAAAVTKRPNLVFRATSAGMATTLFLLLLRLYAY